MELEVCEACLSSNFEGISHNETLNYNAVSNKCTYMSCFTSGHPYTHSRNQIQKKNNTQR